MGTQLVLGGLQGFGHPAQGNIQALLETARLEERQLSGVLFPPVRAGAPQQVACRVTCAKTAIFQDEDLPDEWSKYTQINISYYEDS